MLVGPHLLGQARSALRAAIKFEEEGTSSVRCLENPVTVGPHVVLGPLERAPLLRPPPGKPILGTPPTACDERDEEVVTGEQMRELGAVNELLILDEAPLDVLEIEVVVPGDDESAKLPQDVVERSRSCLASGLEAG